MSPQTTTERRYEIDWLRVLAIFMIFIYHSGRFFNLEDWHVKNVNTYFAVEAGLTFLASWGMPFVFVTSGASTFYALSKRTAFQFAKDRALRLLVPLVVGIFSYSAWQVYLERITHGQFQGSFWAFLPHYFDGLYGFGGNFAWAGMHLWYLEILLIFSLLCLPLLWWLKRGSGARLLERLTQFLARPGAVYLLALPVVAVVITLDPATFAGNPGWGGWCLVAHLLFFLFGFTLVAGHAVQEQILRLRWVSLGAGASLVVVLTVLLMQPGERAFGTWAYTSIAALVSLNTWCWILATWGFARRYLSFGRPFLWRLNEAVLPFYILHQTVLLSVGYIVVQSALPDLFKWIAISTGSFAICLAAYVFLIRPYNIVRIAFGMQPLPRARQPLTTPSHVQQRTSDGVPSSSATIRMQQEQE